MINRANHHVIFDDVELMKQIPKPVCLQVLRQLMWFYEERSRRQAYQKLNRGYEFGRVQLEGIMAIELAEFDKLMSLCSRWLRVPIRIDFTKERNNANKQTRCTNVRGQSNVIKVDMSEA